MPPPYKPFVTSNEDCRNIDLMFLNEKVQETPDTSMTGAEKNKTHFDKFTYDRDNLRGIKSQANRQAQAQNTAAAQQ